MQAAQQCWRLTAAVTMMVRMIRLCVWVLIVTLLLGCEKPAATPPQAPPPPPPRSPSAPSAPTPPAPAHAAAAAAAAATTRAGRHEFGGLTFVPPAGWAVEQTDSGRLLTAPSVENDWHANIFLDLAVDNEVRALESAIDTLSKNHAKQQPRFREIGRTVGDHPSGRRFGRIEFACEREGTPVTQWEFVLELEGQNRLFVVASAATASWEKYRPVFQKFVDSLR